MAAPNGLRPHLGHARTSRPQVRFMSTAHSTSRDVANNSPSSSRPEGKIEIVVGSTCSASSACASDGAESAGSAGDASAYGGAGAGIGVGGWTGAGAGAGDAGARGAAGKGACSTQGKGLAAWAGGFGVTRAPRRARREHTVGSHERDPRRGNQSHKPGHEFHRAHDAVGAPLARDFQEVRHPSIRQHKDSIERERRARARAHAPRARLGAGRRFLPAAACASCPPDRARRLGPAGRLGTVRA